MFAADQVLTGYFLSESLDSLRRRITDNYLVDEDRYLQRLLPLCQLSEACEQRARRRTQRWIGAIRQDSGDGAGIDPLLQEYHLDCREGLVLMSMAEALLRIPDSSTADHFIEDRLLSADWQSHLHADSPFWLNTTTWALAKAQSLVNPTAPVTRFIDRLGKPVMRKALKEAMALMGKRFVMGESLFDALDRSQSVFNRGDSCSFDMLGEAALCRADADAYTQDYSQAIDCLGKNESYPPDCLRPSISIKLSALHPRFEANRLVSIDQLEARVSTLIEQARAMNIALTIDAEEMDRLEPSLDLFQRLYQGPARGWGQLGIAVQAYSKRALPVICWLTKLAKHQSDSIPVRLVKGAYWDSEIKLAQQRGLAGYPVYTRRAATDMSFLACAQLLFSGSCRDLLYPQLATHNAHSLSQLLELSDDRPHEFQRLQGMGQPLYRLLKEECSTPCRIYAPVGRHRHLLPYLVRRLLENGANSSFVNQTQDPSITPEQLSRAPHLELNHHRPSVPLPGALFAPERRNSRGLNLQIESQRQGLLEGLKSSQDRVYRTASLIDGEPHLDSAREQRFAPHNRQQLLGDLHPATSSHAEQALQAVSRHQPAWARTPVEQRAQVLEAWSDALEAHGAELIALLCREGGKTVDNALDELREAVDFCRYYAASARRDLVTPNNLPAITGELNRMLLAARGVFLCISPWNFPLAIFTGQIAAALVTGNGVIAKPAHQCGLIAYRACQLLREAGLPSGVLALLPGASGAISDTLLRSPDIAGIAFTGSTASARSINLQLSTLR